MRFAPRYHRRTAFTIVELLVVISIIVILSALSLSAVFGLRESQIKNVTETTVNKLASALDQQWKATMDQIYEETPATWAVNLSTNGTTRSPDLRRARALYIKGRLRQEFPVNFTEATATIIFASGAGSIPPKPTYQQALAGVTSDPPWSSSAMLYMILSQGRRGMAAASPDNLVDASAIQSQTVNGKTFQYFVDAWGNPVRFFAFPTGNDEINVDPYVKPLVANPYASHDDQDPEDTLMSPAWFPTFRNDFRLKIHDLPAPSNPPAQPMAARHLIPVVASAGKDGLWGIDLRTMAIIAAQANDQQDNIYSYRLRRSGGRGD
jgi:type II secretory pathway pseudopilin PulG